MLRIWVARKRGGRSEERKFLDTVGRGLVYEWVRCRWWRVEIHEASC